MTERYVDIGQIEDAFAWDDEVIDEETGDPVPATYSDGTPMKGIRVDSIHINSDAAADTDAVRKGQMTSDISGAISDHVGESDPHAQYLLESSFEYPFDIDTATPGDVLMLSDDSLWISQALMEPVTGVVNLSAIPDTLTGKDADTVDGIEGAALLKKDGTVALTGDWDIGNGRAIKAATLKARSSSGLFLSEDSGLYGIKINDSGKIEFIGTGGAVGEVDINGDTAFLGALQASGDIRSSTGALLTRTYVQIDDVGIGMFRRDGDVDNNSLWLNKVGYNGGTTRYRDLTVGDGKGNAVLFVDGSDAEVGVGTSSPGGKLEIEVGSTEGKAALVLDQNDEDQPFIVFEGTSDTGLSKNITTDEDSGGVLNGPVLYARVLAGASTYWLPLYSS